MTEFAGQTVDVPAVPPSVQISGETLQECHSSAVFCDETGADLWEDNLIIRRQTIKMAKEGL